MLERFLAPKAGAAYVLMRVVLGLLFAFHGVHGLFGLFGGDAVQFGTQIWFGKILELVAGTAIALGAFTTWAAFLASGEMAVAYVQFHWKLQGGAAAIPYVNEGELALIYSVVFLYIACVGGGACSIDRMRRRRAATT